MSAKDVHVAPIAATDAHRFVRAHHYSGKSVQNSQLHLGAFIDKRLVGVAQFGPPMDRSKLIGLVRDTPWNGMLELNRLAMADATPRNIESRFLSVCFRLIRRNAPHVQWIVSFADATQCGDGTIYRAAGFVLTSIQRNRTLFRLPNGTVVADQTLKSSKAKGKTGRSAFQVAVANGAKPLLGFQLRYIYFLDQKARDRLAVPAVPFAEIDRLGAGMYMGKSRAGSIAADAPAIPAGEGGSTPTPALHLSSPP